MEVAEAEVEKAVEAFDGEGRRIIIALWKDGHVTVCSSSKPGEYECHVTNGKDLYYIAQAFYSGLGFKIRKLGGESR